ncbi:MAG: hypothetical protein GXO25_03245 [Euryarchaeota archaeon]|nr:hypothetical protein [Euryarchaeota archaeon]
MGLVDSGKEMCRIGLVLQIIGSFIPLLGVVISVIGSLLILSGLKNINTISGNYKPYLAYLLVLIFNILMAAIIYFQRDYLMHAGFEVLWLTMWSIVLVSGTLQAIAWWSMWKSTHVYEFRTATLFTFAGAILYVVLIGVVLLLMAVVFLYMAFGEIPNHYYLRSDEDYYEEDLESDYYGDYDESKSDATEHMAEVLAEKF